MSTNMQDLRRDVRKNPADLEREADSARDAVEGTLHELEQQFSPRELVHRVIDMVKRNGGDFGENLVAQVRNNPIPMLLTGVGVAWLMTSSKRGSQGYGNEPNRFDARRFDQERAGAAEAGGSGVGDRWSSAVDSMHDTAAGATNAAQDVMSATATAARGAASTIRGAADAASGVASRAASATRQSAESMAQASRLGVQRVADGYSYLSRQQPLVLGALAVVAGAAIGALLPSTDNEDEWLGAASDEAKTRLKNEAQSKADDLEAVAMAAAASVQESRGETEAANIGEPSADNDDVPVEQPTQPERAPTFETGDAPTK
jgi:hypothetical protein